MASCLKIYYALILSKCMNIKFANKKLRKSFQFDDRLKERSFGIDEGKPYTRDSIRRRFK